LVEIEKSPKKANYTMIEHDIDSLDLN